MSNKDSVQYVDQYMNKNRRLTGTDKVIEDWNKHVKERMEEEEYLSKGWYRWRDQEVY
jgi:hypothetical protein